jgi:hypothetical protein
VTPVVERGEVDGVPVLRSDGIAGRHAAALVFRVGRFDEPLAASGITHMVEHLAFAGRPTAPYAFNASVSGRYTAFYMETGDPADIADFVAAVCRGLTTDASVVLDRERVVLRTEAASRGGAGALGHALAERYGAMGPGIVNYQEFGLRHLSWLDVAAWRQRWFTAGNAVLAIAGDMPRDVRIVLPAGPAAPSADPVSGPLALPGFVATGGSGIGVSFVRQRTALDTYAAVQILHERVTRVLRHELGLTYDVQQVAEELGPELVHSWVAADALTEQVPMASHALLTEFERLIGSGCDVAEIDEVARRMRAAYQGPGASWALLQRAARDLLNGRRSRDPGESASLVAGLEPKHVAEAARELYGQMIVTVPWDVPAVQGRMPALPAWSAAAVSGTVLRSADSDATLTVSDAGVTLTVESGRHNPPHMVTVRFAAVAALVRWRDGKHVLIGDDGFTVQLDPDEWPDGGQVTAEVARRVRPDRIVTLDAEGAPRPGRGRKAAAGAGQAGSTAPPSAATAEAARRKRRIFLATVWGTRALIAVIIIGAIAAHLQSSTFLIAAIAWVSFEFRVKRMRGGGKRRGGR